MSTQQRPDGLPTGPGRALSEENHAALAQMYHETRQVVGEIARSMNGGYLHAEALCLMQYISVDAEEVEYIWNSRDGVTPFIVTSRLGTELRHTDWSRDRRHPAFRPQPGSRVFVDMTPEMARPKAEAYVAKWWEHPDVPMSHSFATREEAVEYFVSDWCKPGTPTLAVVREDGMW